MEPERLSAVMNLLETWRKRVRTNQRIHYVRAEQLERMHRLLGVPAILISAIVGTSILVTLKQDISLWPRVVAGFISYLGAALASLQTFFRFGERASQHQMVGAHFGAIHRCIEKTQAFPPTTLEAAEKLVDDLRKQMDDLPKQAPSIPDRVWKHIGNELTPELMLGTAPPPKQTSIDSAT